MACCLQGRGGPGQLLCIGLLRLGKSILCRLALLLQLGDLGLSLADGVEGLL